MREAREKKGENKQEFHEAVDYAVYVGPFSETCFFARATAPSSASIAPARMNSARE